MLLNEYAAGKDPLRFLISYRPMAWLNWVLFWAI